MTARPRYSLTRTVPASWPEPALKEIVMNRIRYILRIAAVLGGLAAALAAFGAPPAFARPDPDGAYAPAAPAQIPVPVQVRTIVAGGTPGWQITLIAAGARAGRRRHRGAPRPGTDRTTACHPQSGMILAHGTRPRGRTGTGRAARTAPRPCARAGPSRQRSVASRPGTGRSACKHHARARSVPLSMLISYPRSGRSCSAGSALRSAGSY